MLRIDLCDLSGDEGLSPAPASNSAPAAARLVARALLAVREWRGSSPQVDRVGAWSGSALATALVYESQWEQPGREAPLVLSVGECVRRALATSARATVASIAPASGLYADGQVGSDLGRRLARLCDALVLQGHTRAPGAVLRLDHEENLVTVELWSFPALLRADPVAVERALTARFGPCATLRVGRAGARGLPFANLAAGADPPSYVGRGGLGAVFGRLGLKALAISAHPIEERDSSDSRALVDLLTRSPRLAARAAGGTFELFDAYGARGDLRERNYTTALGPSEARAWSSRAGEREVARKGCRGCPTPCGWVFENADAAPVAEGSLARQGGRFSALYALGPNLGLLDFDAALPLLAACDAAGMDAKEVGAALALVCAAQEAGRFPEVGLAPGALWGNGVALRALIDEMLDGRGAGVRLARGARALASELELSERVLEAKGQAVRPESNLAVLLGQCVSSRGADPMRANSFLVGHVDRTRLIDLLAPLDVPRGAEDPLDPAGKGRLVWWHENLMAAIDMSGFCAFSAAGLLADGVCSLDELAAWIAPAALRGESGASRTCSIGERMLAAGASIATLQRALNARLGARAEHDRPEFARAALDRPGMWAEYAQLRGVDASGGPCAETWASVGEPSILDTRLPFARPVAGPPSAALSSAAAATNAHGEPRLAGAVCLRTTGALARIVGGDARFELDLPLPLAAVLVEIERAYPAARGALVRGNGDIVPAVYRAARRLAETDLVHAGDELHLVVALSGG